MVNMELIVNTLKTQISEAFERSISWEVWMANAVLVLDVGYTVNCNNYDLKFLLLGIYRELAGTIWIWNPWDNTHDPFTHLESNWNDLPGRYTPRAGTPPLGRYTPWAGTPPSGRYTPGQVHPRAGTPPPTVHAGLRSTGGRYASYWNAFLF